MTGSCFVTGGAGFIGANFVAHRLLIGNEDIVVLDKLTYAGNLDNLRNLLDNPRLTFVRGDIGDEELVRSLLARHRPAKVVNFAAESHVDRSILAPDDFIATNVMGTMRLLRATTSYFESLDGDARGSFRLLHVSTDEVFGSLAPGDPAFDERTPYCPSSPYAASKAAADHLVRAWHVTYRLPVLTTNCSNNYGPMQFPEKLIPLVVVRSLAGLSVPVYGDGLQRRDWLHVADHCRGVSLVLDNATPGSSYNIGGNAERSNVQVVDQVCETLDRLAPRAGGGRYSELITFVEDRPGHDRRYAVDARRICTDLGWRPQVDFATGIESTVRWYIANQAWVQGVLSGGYRRWIEQNYAARKALV